MNKKAIVLLSGGLDSILATKLIMEQGVEVICVNYYVDFIVCGTGGAGAATRAAEMLKVPLKVINITEEYLELLKKPKHGYGANINPCIDCKIFMLKKSKAYMSEVGASFLVTGEVLGERPMSQRMDALHLIEREAGVKGILLRPLTAKCLELTEPEKAGVVDREKLLAIQGRSRKPQMDLAAKFGISEYPNPAGGCLLTDPGFANRVKDLFKYGPITSDEMNLLKIGRHFRLTDKTKLIVGRDEDENEALQKFKKNNDIAFELTDLEGPYALLRGDINDSLIKTSAAIAAYHTKFRNEPSVKISYWKEDLKQNSTMLIEPAKKEFIESVRI